MNKLPSRRYVCKVCKRKGRRNNSAEDRLKEPICPACERGLGDLDRLAPLIPFWTCRNVLRAFRRMLSKLWKHSC